MPPVEPRVPNLLIFVADALRLEYARSHLPEFPGSFVRTIAQGNRTPMSFPTIVSGLGPYEHGIREFQDPPLAAPTVFDLPQVFPEYDVGYFDHPNDPTVRLLGDPPVRRLEDLSEPFVYVERELSTHTPYGTSWWRQLDDDADPLQAGVGMGGEYHNARFYPDYTGSTGEPWADGREYIDLMMDGEVDFREDYRRGVQQAVGRFRSHLDYLSDEGLLEDTFVVFTADHGEVWGPHDDRPGRWIHNIDVPEVIDVGTLFYGRSVNVTPPLLLKDVVRQWTPRWDEIVTEIDTTASVTVDQDKQAVEDRLRDLGYME